LKSLMGRFGMNYSTPPRRFAATLPSRGG
jgi:hypothetical protein